MTFHKLPLVLLQLVMVTMTTLQLIATYRQNHQPLGMVQSTEESRPSKRTKQKKRKKKKTRWGRAFPSFISLRLINGQTLNGNTYFTQLMAPKPKNIDGKVKLQFLGDMNVLNLKKGGKSYTEVTMLCKKVLLDSCGAFKLHHRYIHTQENLTELSTIQDVRYPLGALGCIPHI